MTHRTPVNQAEVDAFEREKGGARDVLPPPRPGERREPMRFVVESFSVHVLDRKGKSAWAAEVVWDEDDACFTLEDVHNFTFAPCDLLELARILRTIPREFAAAPSRAPILPANSTAAAWPSPSAAEPADARQLPSPPPSGLDPE